MTIIKDILRFLKLRKDYKKNCVNNYYFARAESLIIDNVYLLGKLEKLKKND